MHSTVVHSFDVLALNLFADLDNGLLKRISRNRPKHSLANLRLKPIINN